MREKVSALSSYCNIRPLSLLDCSKVEVATFASGDVIDGMLREVEGLYAARFGLYYALFTGNNTQIIYRTRGP